MCVCVCVCDVLFTSREGDIRALRRLFKCSGIAFKFIVESCILELMN